MFILVEKIIGKLKKDPTYKLDSNYSAWEFFLIVYYRMIQIIRGGYYRLFLHSDGILFCGKKVSIRYASKIKAGKSLILEDGVYLDALSVNGIELGDNVTIAKYSVLTCTGVIANKGVGIKIGNNCAIGAQSFLGGQGGIELKNDVIMGPQVKIFSENHNYDNLELLIRKQGESRKNVLIEENCWIGAGVAILAGVTIGKGSIIAAGSVVTKSVPPFSVTAGVPAKVLKSRIN